MSISWKVCFRVDIVIVCICQDVYVCMFFFMYAVKSMYICLNVFVFIYFYACKSDERGREKSLEEGKLIA